ncbi:aspartyl-tRNA(Asn)/glutamyl-tRNA(Gln) amidotransferase subunit A|uniref:Aspartyl-tRNA(Asn)/glutamyl-tRNA(Gln) amidotransferase subunit A n=1 Tax=Brenneria salicis ATCC 15712 = DSM 30166 TaxID=714314 RepID=A0A366HX88_9GAMM|nr:AtzE family amidohydrolase [Brenneria salicis]NMN92454.1 aspartyl-tRNA(Asn)/glutamyl-tRNA(Gln) amidotransferase subunit A [Brenneria salicis ATCC 15712 = DSM 30166]RBP58187.1 aspartyl-tRNA(Asn)/glutamyl-tRNA(Gln) amidotransferase subunit A [Brenneria salicis ATCC 15712 = DSM 30166]RLM29107.1 amidase [Brenneria salicis ATCC 15712 = DSM 30166]
MSEFPLLSIKQTRQGLLAGEFSAREIAQQTLNAIEQANPDINAYTQITHQRMLDEADRVDRMRMRGETLPPLAGVPYAVKNLFDVAGATTLAGAQLFSQRAPAGQDAFAIRRLANQGGLLSGMLNMDAYAYGFTTENSYYGATRNPLDQQRVAGGSSGGSAAAVAAGLVTFTLGSDTNGSIRVPASLCGIFGLKPTFGRLSRSGSQPFVASLDHIGPLARSTEDLALAFDALQGRDHADRFQSERAPLPCAPLLEAGDHGLRCTVLAGYFAEWSGNEAKTAVQKIADALNAPTSLTLPDADLARTAAFIMSASEGGNHYLPALRQSPELFEPLSRERLLAGAMIPAAWYVQAQRFRDHFRQQVLSLFEHTDLLIAPATPCTATLIGQETMHINGVDLPVRASMGMLTQPISFVGLPVVTVPVMTDNGLPIGIQLIGAPWREDLCLRAAWMLEQRGITAIGSFSQESR